MLAADQGGLRLRTAVVIPSASASLYRMSDQDLLFTVIALQVRAELAG